MSASRSFPGFDRVFYLGEPGGSRAFRVCSNEASNDEVFWLTRAENEHASVSARWVMGEASPRDFINSTSLVRIISDRVVEILRRLECTGWKTYPVEVRGKHGELIPGYNGLAILGRCGPIDDARSVRFDKAYPGGVFPCWRGYYFDEASWDGSDLFMPMDQSLRIFLVDRVRRALIRANVRNVEFTALDQVERMPLPNTGDPPRLT